MEGTQVRIVINNLPKRTSWQKLKDWVRRVAGKEVQIGRVDIDTDLQCGCVYFKDEKSLQLAWDSLSAHHQWKGHKLIFLLEKVIDNRFSLPQATYQHMEYPQPQLPWPAVQQEYLEYPQFYVPWPAMPQQIPAYYPYYMPTSVPYTIWHSESGSSRSTSNFDETLIASPDTTQSLMAPTAEFTDPPVVNGSSAKFIDPPVVDGSCGKFIDPPVVNRSCAEFTSPPVVNGSCTEFIQPPVVNGSCAKFIDPPVVDGSMTRPR